MHIDHCVRFAVAIVMGVTLAACGDATQSASPGSSIESGQSATAGPVVHVYKSATCDCCSSWEARLRDSGFQVDSHSEPDMTPIKTKFGVPERLSSCHTAVVDGYVVEGHVPAADIRRLLAERPKGKGIAVPGMPMGSPGMEHGSHHDPYDVILFGNDHETQVFASH